MKIVAGLGNKGTKYSKNRHNTGFIAVDNLAENWENESKFDSEISKSENFIFIKPQTYMNDSGKAVSKVMNFYKISPDDLIVIHDDLDLPFSKVKKQFDAGPAGHNGIISIIEQLGTQKFWRIRVGIGRPQDSRIDPSDYVLSDFTVDELKEIQALNLEELLK